MADVVTVAVPVRNGGALLDRALAAVRSQRIDREIELLVADSGSTDGSREVARRHGAELIDVAPGEFSHGRTRNRLAERAAGSHVVFITQDSVPADELWLERLLAGFAAADDVALVFGPYVPRDGASLMVRRELEAWFGSLSTEVERGDPGHGDVKRLFFTDANGCVARAAWERVPFRDVPYAEDHLLARDMLAAGYAKLYRPEAAVIHSHDYSPIDQLRRSFDEWRGLRQVHGLAARPLAAALAAQRAVRDDVAAARAEGTGGVALARLAAESVRYHAMRAAGSVLGSRADRLPRRMQAACSLEGRVAEART